MKKKYYYLFLLPIVAILLIGFTEDNYYKINKSFEVFGSIYKIINDSYVLEVDPEQLMENAITGMLSSLDPYTTYFKSNNNDELDIVSYGNYTGFGLNLSEIDSLITITNVVDGFAASKGGLKIGDVLTKIDSIYINPQSYDKIKDYMRGELGVPATFYVMREGATDTLQFTIKREQIQLKDIPIYEMLDDTTAYIKIDTFSDVLISEFKDALYNLKYNNDLRALIIDLRENPGGIIGAAVSVCEAFLPNGSLVVETKGKSNSEGYKYETLNNPIEPDIPILVMINENTASASEIVAGALQDHDRAVIVGQRSYGKGLVQSIVPLPYNSNLKITSAKYYLSSGRCVQRIKFAEQYQSNSTIKEAPDDTSSFYTKNGRKVYESTGINPDTTLEAEIIPEFIYDLYKNFMFFKFASKYTANWTDLPAKYKADDALFNNFKKFFDNQNYKYKSISRNYLEDFKESTSETKMSKNFYKNVNALEKELDAENQKALVKNKKVVLSFLDEEIKRRFSTEREVELRHLENDKELKDAKSILDKGLYYKILSP